MDIIEDDFCAKMIRKYPDLFPKDAEGKPCEPECGFGCPTAWEPIVEGLLNSIDNHVKYPGQIQTWVWLHKISCFFYYKMIRPVGNRILQELDPIEKFRWKDGVRSEWIILTPLQIKASYDEHPIQTYIHKKASAFVRSFSPTFRYKRRAVRPVTIEQVKQKFSTLRFYYTGGDDHIRSIVSFTEALSSRFKR